jgi:hypothetical protein
VTLLRYAPSRSRISSGSRRAERPVESTRSQNITVSRRRSAPLPEFDADARRRGDCSTTGSVSLLPHSPQHRADTGLAVPHAGQGMDNSLRHDVQNFAPVQLTWWHPGHCICSTLRQSPGGPPDALFAEVARDSHESRAQSGSRAQQPPPPKTRVKSSAKPSQERNRATAAALRSDLNSQRDNALTSSSMAQRAKVYTALPLTGVATHLNGTKMRSYSGTLRSHGEAAPWTRLRHSRSM